MNETLLESAVQRLKNFLSANNQTGDIETLTPDASTREYFRINWKNQTAIACVYGEAFKATEHNYLDATRLFLSCDLPVAEIYAFDEAAGIVVQEDFGDRLLRDVLIKNGGDDETLLDEAIRLIARIQAATAEAYKCNSIAARLRFDEEKLLWELNYFKTHYFETFRRSNLDAADDAALSEEFGSLARSLEERAAVLCHRDFHAANLMIDEKNRLRIIDHQDARIGAASYDLVSLLLDRVEKIPASEWLDAKKNLLLAEREKLGLEPIEFGAFDNEFQMQTIQRGLKAVGTFSFQSVNRGKTRFVPYISPTLKIVLEAARKLNKYPRMQKIVEREIYDDVRGNS